MGQRGGRGEYPSVSVRHEVEIYYEAYGSETRFQARCSCGWTSEIADEGILAWAAARQLHPEGTC